MELFDTHFHYYKEDETVSSYAEKARRAGVRYLLAAGADFEESRLARNFSNQTSGCWFSAGVHPHAASLFTADISMFDEFLPEPRLAAIGEVGLDYFYENSERPAQKKVFSAFVEMALKNKLPLIVHCRDKLDKDDAYEDAFGILSGFAGQGGKFVLHCFTGTNEWCLKFLELGAFVSVGGIITFPKAANVRELLKAIPDDRLLLETDSPYLAPVPHRGTRNHPEYLAIIAGYVAGQKKMPVEKLAELTTDNAFRFFKMTKDA
ncbi:MAG TPA: hypothetical protein DCZ94_02310 [Lentisphaeria bacterium]|nr:MAG: hypothetical protein A2X48_16240 [Lentisphaerae bacterium GWF2_49_21]HBC85767.1 hypothetical protein [Lentisphaeria bacterium]